MSESINAGLTISLCSEIHTKKNSSTIHITVNGDVGDAESLAASANEAMNVLCKLPAKDTPEQTKE